MASFISIVTKEASWALLAFSVTNGTDANAQNAVKYGMKIMIGTDASAQGVEKHEMRGMIGARIAKNALFVALQDYMLMTIQETARSAHCAGKQDTMVILGMGANALHAAISERIGINGMVVDV
jgi:hypothetical protein